MISVCQMMTTLPDDADDNSHVLAVRVVCTL